MLFSYTTVTQIVSRSTSLPTILNRILPPAPFCAYLFPVFSFHPASRGGPGIQGGIEGVRCILRHHFSASKAVALDFRNCTAKEAAMQMKSHEVTRDK
jgi:hypothetical protein